MTVHVTNHAVLRWQQRVERCTAEEARSRILASSRAIEVAIGFGGKVVRLGNGAKLVLEGNRVVTVLQREWMSRDNLKPLAGREEQ